MIGIKDNTLGIDSYTLPSNELMLKKPQFGKCSKGKNLTFAEEVMKRKQWVPGPQYINIDNWNNLLPKRAG